MVTQEALKGRWKEIKGKLHARWGQLSEDELEQARGNVEQLVGAIQRKTGAAREDIEKYLDDAARGGTSRVQKTADVAQQHASSAADYVQGAASQASDYVQEAASQAADYVQGAASHAADAAREGYVQAQEMVQRRPFESLVTCFGIGVVTGVLVGLMLRSK